MHHLFEHAARHQPAVISIDEIDNVCGDRGKDETASHDSKVKSILLTELSQVHTRGLRVLLLGATIYPERLDDGFIRRFTRFIHIQLPTQEEKVALFMYFLKKYPHDLHLGHLWNLAEHEATLNFSGSDINNLIMAAGAYTLTEFKKKGHRVWKKVSRHADAPFVPCYVVLTSLVGEVPQP